LHTHSSQLAAEDIKSKSKGYSADAGESKATCGMIRRAAPWIFGLMGLNNQGRPVLYR